MRINLIYISTLWVEKLEEFPCKAHFIGKFQFGKFGSKNFWSHFKAWNGIFWGYNIQKLYQQLRYWYAYWYLSKCMKITSIRARMWKLFLSQVHLPCWPPWYEWMACHTPLLTHMGIDMCVISRWLYKFKTLSLMEGLGWKIPNTRHISDYVKYWAARRRKEFEYLAWYMFHSWEENLGVLFWENNKGRKYFLASI